MYIIVNAELYICHSLLAFNWDGKCARAMFCARTYRGNIRDEGVGVCVHLMCELIFPVSWAKTTHEFPVLMSARQKKVATVQQCALSRHQGSLFLIRCWLTFPDPSHNWHGLTVPDPLLAHFSWSVTFPDVPGIRLANPDQILAFLIRKPDPPLRLAIPDQRITFLIRC